MQMANRHMKGCSISLTSGNKGQNCNKILTSHRVATITNLNTHTHTKVKNAFNNAEKMELLHTVGNNVISTSIIEEYKGSFKNKE
jgi:hypothetical protein